MSAIATAVVAGAAITSYASSQSADKAAEAQSQSSEAGIAEQRRQFDAVQKILQPYVEAGTGALGGYGSLLGLEGPEAQSAAIKGIEQSPEFEALIKQGEEGILQNASATGGLRGGNVQSALAQFRPSILSSLINQRYTRLGELAQLGQASAAGTGSAGIFTGKNISNLLTQQGQAQAGAALAQGQAVSNFAQSIPTAVILSGGF